MPILKKIKAASFLFLLVLMISCSSKKDNIRSKQAELYFGAGTQGLMDQQYTEALKNLLKANELDPENSQILNNLGMAYYFKDEKETAIETLHKALKIDPKNSDAKINLASILYREGDVTQAEKVYKQVLKDLTYDKQARTLFNLGLLELQKKKNNLAAEDYFKKSLKEDDNYCPASYQLGLIKFNRRQFSSALKNFKDATIGTCYDSPAPHYYQALTLAQLRRFDEARIKYDEIDTRFKNTVFAVKARNKVIELNQIQNKNSNESHAARNVLESPDF